VVVQRSTATRANSVEMECLGDFDQPTAHSADALLRRDPPQLTRLTSSDREDDLEFDGTAADHDDDEEEEEHPPGYMGFRFVRRRRSDIQAQAKARLFLFITV